MTHALHQQCKINVSRKLTNCLKCPKYVFLVGHCGLCSSSLLPFVLLWCFKLQHHFGGCTNSALMYFRLLSVQGHKSGGRSVWHYQRDGWRCEQCQVSSLSDRSSYWGKQYSYAALCSLQIESSPNELTTGEFLWPVLITNKLYWTCLQQQPVIGLQPTLFGFQIGKLQYATPKPLQPITWQFSLYASMILYSTIPHHTPISLCNNYVHVFIFFPDLKKQNNDVSQRDLLQTSSPTVWMNTRIWMCGR